MIGEDFAKLAVKHWSALLSINFSCQLKNSYPWFVRSNVRIYFIRMTGRLSRNWHAALIIWNHLLSDSQNSLGDQGIIGLLGGRRVEIGHFWEKLGRSFSWGLHYKCGDPPVSRSQSKCAGTTFWGQPWERDHNRWWPSQIRCLQKTWHGLLLGNVGSCLEETFEEGRRPTLCVDPPLPPKSAQTPVNCAGATVAKMRNKGRIVWSGPLTPFVPRFFWGKLKNPRLASRWPTPLDVES